MSDDYEHTVWFGGLPSDIISGLHPQIVAEFLEDAKYGTVDRVEMKELCFLVRFERKIDAQKCAAKRRVNVRGHVAVVCMYEQAENRARQRRRSRSRSVSRSRSRRSRMKSRSRSRSDRRKATDRGRKIATNSLKVTNSLAPRASLAQRYKPHIDDKVPIRAPPIPASDRQNFATASPIGKPIAKPTKGLGTKGLGKANGASGYVSGKGTNGLASEVIGHLKTLHDHLGRADLQRIELQLKRVTFSEQIQAMKTFLDSEPRELKNPVGWFQGILKSISMRAGNIPSIRGGMRASPRDNSHSQSSSSSSSPSRVVRRQVVRKVARSPSQRGRSRGSPRATKKPLRSWSQSAGSSRSSMKSWSQPVKKQSVAKSSSESSSRSENNNTAEKKTVNNNVRATGRVASPGSAVRRKRPASKESAKSSDLANWDDVTSQSSPVKKVELKKIETAVKVSKERVAIEKPEKPKNKDKVNNYCFGTPIHVPTCVSIAGKESKSAWGTWATQDHDTGVASSTEANENTAEAAFPRRQVKLKPREAEVASSKDERKSRVVLKKAPPQQQEEVKSPEASEEKKSPDEENPEQEEQEEIVLKKRRSSEASSSSQKSAEPHKSEEPVLRNDAPEPDGQSGSSRSPSPLVLKEAKEDTSNSKKPSDEAIRVAEQAEKQALAVLASEQLATEKGEESPSERIQRIKTALAATRKAAEALKASGEKPKARVVTKLPVKAVKPKTKVEVRKKKVVLPKAAEKRPLLAPESTRNKKKNKVEGKPLTLAEANKLVSLMFRSSNGTVKRVVHRGETTLAQIFESRGKDPRKYQFVFDGRKVSRKITVKELEDSLPKGSNGTVEIDWDKLIAVRLHVAQDVFEDNLPGQMTIQKLFVDLWERGVKETIEGLNCQNKAGVEFAGDLTLATLDTRYSCSQNKKPLKLFITDSKWDSDCGF